MVASSQMKKKLTRPDFLFVYVELDFRLELDFRPVAILNRVCVVGGPCARACPWRWRRPSPPCGCVVLARSGGVTRSVRAYLGVARVSVMRTRARARFVFFFLRWYDESSSVEIFARRPLRSRIFLVRIILRRSVAAARRHRAMYAFVE